MSRNDLFFNIISNLDDNEEFYVTAASETDSNNSRSSFDATSSPSSPKLGQLRKVGQRHLLHQVDIELRSRKTSLMTSSSTSSHESSQNSLSEGDLVSRSTKTTPRRLQHKPRPHINHSKPDRDLDLADLDMDLTSTDYESAIESRPWSRENSPDAESYSAIYDDDVTASVDDVTEQVAEKLNQSLNSET